jgi:hypothetical protein
MAISGWTQLFHTQFTSNVISHGAWAKIAAGSDTATLTGAAQDFAAVVLRIENHGVSNIASDVKVGTAATGTSATPNPPSLDAGASRKHLWIASNGSDDDDEAVSFPLEPSGFTGVCQIESAQSTSSCMLQVAQLAEETQTKDPGTFNLGASEEWIAQTIAVPPAVSAAIPPFRSRMHSALLARRQRFGRDRETGLFLPTGLLGRRAA